MAEHKSDFLVGVAVGSGFVATAAERGGADFLLALSAGRMRNMGAPSIACVLPNFDAASLALDYARTEVLPAVSIPALLGTTCWQSDVELEQQARSILLDGFAGATNFPPSGLLPNYLHAHLNRAGLGFSREVEMLVAMHILGGFAVVYCTTIDQARQSALAGINHILFNYGWNAGGALGHKTTMPMENAALVANSLTKQVRRINPAAKILLEGGPIISEADLAFIMRSAQIDGYIGGSTIERLPLERSISDQIASYRMAQLQLTDEDTTQHELTRWATNYGFVCKSSAMQAYVTELRSLARSHPRVAHVACSIGDSNMRAIEALVSHFPSATKPKQLIVNCAIDRERRALLDVLAKYNEQSKSEKPDIIQIHQAEQLKPIFQDRLVDLIQRFMTSKKAQFPQLIFASEYSRTNPEGFDGLTSDLARLLREASLRMPALAKRPEDIEQLICEIAETSIECDNFRLSASAVLKLRGHAWTNNERELLTFISSFAQQAKNDMVVAGHDVDTWLAKEPISRSNKQTLVGDPRSEIVEALWRNGFRKGRTAQSLGISRKTLYNRMQRYGIG